MATLLSPALLNRMIKDPKFHTEFKFLKNPPKKPQKSCCGEAVLEYDLNRVKNSILGMPDNRQRRMKEMLGVSILKVWYRDARGVQNSREI
jgi:hypothetical protein